MVGPVIQVAGRLDSEDGLRTGNLCEVESAFIGRGVVLPWAERARAPQILAQTIVKVGLGLSSFSDKKGPK